MANALSFKEIRTGCSTKGLNGKTRLIYIFVQNDGSPGRLKQITEKVNMASK